jgi:hypothetical protein
MLDSQLNTAIVAWIQNGTGINTVFRANLNGPCPWPTNYATFQIIAAPAHLHADDTIEAGAEEGDITITHIVHVPVTVSVNVYHIDGMQLITQLWNSKRTYAGRYALNQINAAVLSYSGPRDLTGLRDTDWKPRFQADFVLNYRTLLVETNKTVDKLSLTGKIESDDVEIIGWDELP